MKTKELISTIKAEGQDFEWYPTTDAMLAKISSSIRTSCDTRKLRILDIGAGNGNALSKLSNGIDADLYAIEISSILIDAMPSDVYVIGTDFHAQTLIDKEVDVVFCNPPYSEFEQWAARIIREANCREIYLVIPERWHSSKAIAEALEQRDATASVIYSSDFAHSEYRESRAKVDILKIRRGEYLRERLPDPFSLWFDSTFSLNADTRSVPDYEVRKDSEKRLHGLVAGTSLIPRLEELYHNDLEHLYNNYRAIEKLDAEILKELKVNVDALKDGLRLRISGLKNLYWKELFEHLSSITDRLTTKSRSKMLERLTSHTCVDFTSNNAYAVVIWAIKNANSYLDDQLKDVYWRMSRPENVHRYKSNAHFVAGSWRYNREDSTMNRYSLDYRIVFPCGSAFSTLGYDSYDYPGGLSKYAHDEINDMLTISRNLGFMSDGSTRDRTWSPGEEQVFMANNEELLRVRAFKNGNIHCKFNQKFIRRLNVEAGRLYGWIKSPTEAASEMDIPLNEARRSFGSHMRISARMLYLLENIEI